MICQSQGISFIDIYITSITVRLLSGFMTCLKVRDLSLTTIIAGILLDIQLLVFKLGKTSKKVYYKPEGNDPITPTYIHIE